MESLCIISGELDGDFAGEATCNDHGDVNQSSGDYCEVKQPKKEAKFIRFAEKSFYTYSDNELGKKKEVNSTGSRLYVLRLSNHLSLPRI